MAVKNRADISKEYKWKLEDIFETDRLARAAANAIL